MSQEPSTTLPPIMKVDVGFPVKTVESLQGSRKCFRCKATNLIEYKFCSQCGYQLQKENIRSSSGVEIPKLLSMKLQQSLPFYESQRQSNNQKNRKKIERPRKRKEITEEFSREGLPSAVEKALFTPLTPSQLSPSQESVFQLNIMEQENVELVENGYRLLRYERKKHFEKPPEQRFPPVKPATASDHFRQNHHYLLTEVMPISQQYQFLRQRLKLFTSTSFPSREMLNDCNEKDESERHGEEIWEEEENQQEKQPKEEPKAWLWGSSIFSDQHTIVQEDSFMPHSHSIESLQSYSAQNISALQEASIDSLHQTPVNPPPASNILFWGNISAIEENSAESAIHKDMQDSVKEETFSVHEDGDAEKIQEVAYSEIDWKTVTEAQLQSRHEYRYVSNLHIGKMLMDCNREIKAILPRLEVDQRITSSSLAEPSLLELQRSIEEGKELLKEARVFVPQAIEDELQSFETSSQSHRYRITEDIATGLRIMSDIEREARQRYQQVRKKVESSASGYILDPKNRMLLQKFLEENPELQELERQVKDQLQRVGGLIQILVGLEEKIVRSLQQEDFAVKQTINHWQPILEKAIYTLSLALDRAVAWLSLS